MKQLLQSRVDLEIECLKDELLRLKQAANIEVNTLIVDQLIIKVNQGMRALTRKIIQKRTLISVILGSVTGMLMAFSNPFSDQLDNSVIVTINDVGISKTEYLRAASLFDQDKRGAMTLEDRELILDRLIEEELLVQQAISSGALRSDLNVRQRTLQTMLDAIQSTSAFSTAEKSQTQSFALDYYLQQLRDSASIEWLNQSKAETSGHSGAMPQ